MNIHLKKTHISIGLYQKPFKIFFKRFYLFIFREKAREGEREGEKHVWLPLALPLLGTRPHPGIQPATLWFAGRHSIH